MKVVFFDRMRETYESVDNVVQINSSASRINGRLTNVWSLILADGNTRAFKQKDFTIQRVEI